MINYIKGAITYKTPTFIIIETAGVGYGVHVSLHTYATVEKLENTKILIYQHIKEDSNTLYGFAEDAERKLFTYLISVSGIGPSTAQVVLSSMNPGEVQAAIVGEDVAAFNRVKGIGPKTAKRLILDLKDKLLKDGVDSPLTLPAGANNTVRQEALSALVSLGFPRIQAQKVLTKILKTKSVETSEELIKLALKQFS